MSKLNFKTITIFLLLFLIVFTTCVFAEDTNSEDAFSVKNEDLFLSENKYSIKNVINGNVYTSVKDLELDPSYNGGIITGNLYATANTINIKSNLQYSENEKDNFGNPKIESIKSISKINGNVFVTANKFVLGSECQINGDLYICANEITLSQNAVITGNVFAIGNKLTLNAKIENGNLYANVKNFEMPYYGFISRDLNLSAESSSLSGYIYRNSSISSKKLETTSTFINRGDFNVTSASEVHFSGEVKGNSYITSKSIIFNTRDDSNKSITCKITGDLNYSSTSEIEIEDNIVNGNINYTKYKNENNFLSKLGEYVISLLSSLVYVILLYLVINKFSHKFINDLYNIKISNFFSSIGFGFIFIILLFPLSLLLLLTRVGALLSLLIWVLFILMLLIAKPIFIISLSGYLSNKNKNIKNIFIVAFITIILSLLSLIPVLGFIISLLVTLCGLGIIIVKSLKK